MKITNLSGIGMAVLALSVGVPAVASAEEGQRANYDGTYDVTLEGGLLTQTAEFASLEVQRNFNAENALALAAGIGEPSLLLSYKLRGAGDTWNFAFVPSLAYQPRRTETFSIKEEVSNKFENLVYAGTAFQLEARDDRAFLRFTLGLNFKLHSQKAADGDGGSAFPMLPILSVGGGFTL